LQIGKLYGEKKVSADLFALACKPDKRVRIYSACVVDGVRYHTLDREKYRKTQNSGIVSEGEHDGEDIDFYGQLRRIIKLQYNSSGGIHRSVILFRCDWFDLGGKKTGVKDDGYFKSINTGRCWYKNDPFILTTQASKVFYVPDTGLRGNWRVVQKFQHRHLWSVTETDIEKGPGGGGGLTYQDEDSEQVPVQAKEGSVRSRLRRDRECVLVDAATVEKIKKRRKTVAGAVGDDDDEQIRADDTEMQYHSDPENNRAGFGIEDDEY
jgi:hypothetical protein